MRTLEFDEQQDALILVDQTRLPRETVFVTCRDAEDIARAMASMKVRGAPAIGVTAAYGLVLAARAARDESPDRFLEQLQRAADVLGNARPTAVNLRWALDKVMGQTRWVLAREGVAAAAAAT